MGASSNLELDLSIPLRTLLSYQINKVADCIGILQSVFAAIGL